MYRVYLSGSDISKYIAKVDYQPITKNEYGQLTILENLQLDGLNYNDFWNQYSYNSPFFGSDIRDFNVKLYYFDDLVFDGFVLNISLDDTGRKSKIDIESKLNKKLSKGLIYSSETSSTPATIFKEICEFYEIDYDSESIGQSNYLYNIDNIQYSAFFEGDLTILDGLQSLAEVACARIYEFKNRLCFEQYQQYESNTNLTITDNYQSNNNVFFSEIEIENIEKDEVKGYNIQWVGDGFGNDRAILGNENEQGKNISANYDSNIRIMTLQSAIWTGQQWIDYMNRPKKIYRFDIDLRLSQELSIRSSIKIMYKNSMQIVDIISIKNHDVLSSSIEAVTR